MEGDIMTDYVSTFSDGQVLEADDMNKIRSARTGDVLPIDDTTSNYTDVAGGLGDPTRAWADGEIDNLKMDGNTLSSTSGDINITPLAGNSTIIGSSASFDPSGNLALTSIATDGNAAIKIKSYSGTTDSDAGTSIAHGLTAGNIIAVDGNVLSTGSVYTPFNNLSSPAVAMTWDATNILLVHADASFQGQAYRMIAYYI